MWTEESRDTLPDFEETRDRVLSELIRFTRSLRYQGVAVPANAVITAAEALVLVGVTDRDDVRAALRSVFISREEDIPVFERLFPVFWRRLQGEDVTEENDDLGVAEEESVEVIEELGGMPDAESDQETDSREQNAGAESLEELGVSVGREDESDRDTSETVTSAVYSPAGQSSPIAVTENDLYLDTDLESSIHALTRVLASLPGRRWGASGTDRVDTRRALRESFGTGGTVMSVPQKSRRRSAVQATMLVDVSRSVLDTIDRGFLLDFLRAVHHEWRRVRIFFFDTQVREFTAAFGESTPQAALDELQAVETEWGGGTQIGKALTTIRTDHPNAIGRDSIMFVISDGLEVGEIDVLETGMAWISQRASAVLWLNPLATSPQYEPTCRGMEASLPYIDGLFSFSDVSDIIELTRQIEQHGLRGRIGYEYDPRRSQ